MRADSKADIIGAGNVNAHRAADAVHDAIVARDAEEDVFALALQTHAARAMDRRFNEISLSALFGAILQRGDAIAVDQNVSERRAGIEAGADDDAGFAVR